MEGGDGDGDRDNDVEEETGMPLMDLMLRKGLCAGIAAGMPSCGEFRPKPTPMYIMPLTSLLFACLPSFTGHFPPSIPGRYHWHTKLSSTTSTGTLVVALPSAFPTLP